MPHDLRRPGWRNTSVDEQVFTGEGWLFGVSADHTTAGLAVTLYDALGVVAERKIMTLEVPTNQHRGVSWWPPLPITQGLYVDVASGGQDVLIEYMADPGFEMWGYMMNSNPPRGQGGQGA